MKALFDRIGCDVGPRVLGLGDREPASAAYGCFDRGYWRYLVADFPCAWFQSAAYYLAGVYAHESGSNPFFGRESLREWSLAAVDFTAKIAHRDGSVDEAYPNERSYCATAFCLAWTSGALLTLDETVRPRLILAGEWLRRRHPPEASNQLAAAALGLARLWRLTGDRFLREAGFGLVDRLIDRQHGEGYFPEYGGVDLGYLSLTLSLLAAFNRLLPDAGLKGPLSRAGGYLDRYVGEDGRLDPDRRGRGTQYLYPSGLVEWAPGALDRLTGGLERGLAMAPSWLDDRYVTPLAADYLDAAAALG